MAHTYLFVDMNSYFASVEQQDRPYLRGLPTAVIPMDAPTTCCIAASYEAKYFGVKTGTGVREARELCPQLQLVIANPKRYVQYHHRIVEIVESCLPIAQVCSIDEMYGKLIGDECEPDKAKKIANRIKTRMWTQLGSVLRCSIGIAPNIWLAKVATDLQKPDGLTFVALRDLPGILFSLELTDLPGIAHGMERRLGQSGITTVEQLCALSVDQLAEIWGSRVMAQIWWHQLRGRDLPFRPMKRKTVGHSHVLPPTSRSDEASRSVMVRLIHKAASRMRRLGYHAGYLTAKVDHMDAPGWSARGYLGICRDTLTMLHVFDKMWATKPNGKPLRVGVVLTHLIPDQSAPHPLFAKPQALSCLSDAMDRLDAKYGHHTLYFGSMFGFADAAPARISFTQIPGMDEF